MLCAGGNRRVVNKLQGDTLTAAVFLRRQQAGQLWPVRMKNHRVSASALLVLASDRRDTTLFSSKQLAAETFPVSNIPLLFFGQILHLAPHRRISWDVIKNLTQGVRLGHQRLNISQIDNIFQPFCDSHHAKSLSIFEGPELIASKYAL